MDNRFWAIVGIIWLVGILILMVTGLYILHTINWHQIFGLHGLNTKWESNYTVSDYGTEYSWTVQHRDNQTYKMVNQTTCISQYDAYDRRYDNNSQCWVRVK